VVVGKPSPEELRSHRQERYGGLRKAMTDAAAKRLGIKPVEVIGQIGVFPKDRLMDHFDVCRSTMDIDEQEFNPSIAIFKNERWLAYRQNIARSNIFVAKCNVGWEPFSPDECRIVNIPLVPENQSGREDPRFFQFRGELWLSYAGYSQKHKYPSTVCIGRLNDRGEMDCHFPLHYEHRQTSEKNWVFFEHNERLLCVYQSTPHMILDVDLFNCRATTWNTVWKSPFKQGVIRGGASPVLHNGEWYHWFHGVQWGGHKKVYSLGVLTFENQPPFRVTRCCQRAMYLPDETEADPNDQLAVFPGGAVLDRGRWFVACGHLDKSCRILSFTLDDIEAELVKV
jgi:predicted GH43/DUF377 family glycosyl hydrolase